MILKNVSFSNVPNKKQGTKIGTMLTQSNIEISREVNEYLQSEDFYKLISALDIDWAGIEIDANTTINDTADLINWIKSISVNGGSGEPGSKGPQGDLGSKGIQGSTGIQGTKGAQGSNGNPGNPGTQGLIGEQGLNGEQGLIGEQGLTGDKGIQGESGESGITGNQGNQGDKGIQGTQGIQGSKGIQGVKGNQGVPGIVQGNVVTSNIQWLKINVVDVMPETPDENTLYIVQ